MIGNNNKSPGVIDSHLNTHHVTIPPMRETRDTMINAFLVMTLYHNVQILSPANTQATDTTLANILVPLQINRDNVINKRMAMKKTPTEAATAIQTLAIPHKTSIEDATIRR